MKPDNRMGFTMYNHKHNRGSIREWVVDNTLEILMLILFVAMIYGVGIIMSTTAKAVDLMIEYSEIETETVDNYQRKQVAEALMLKRIEDSAEQPPYWTVPVEDY